MNYSVRILLIVMMLFISSFGFSAEADWGAYQGTALENKNTILQELDAKTGKPLMELFLCEAFRPKGSPIAPNMGGHIALAVGDTGYSVSSIYQKKNGKIFVILPKQDMLYGTKDSSGEIPFGTGIGCCYVRAVWGVRVYKLPSKYNLDKVKAFAKWANEKASSDNPEIAYQFRRNNCATITARALFYGGFRNYTEAKHVFDFPRDVMTDLLQELISLPEGEAEWEIVRYAQVPTGKYWKSQYVPNLEWQRLLKSLPFIRSIGKNETSLKKNASLEIVAEKTDRGGKAVIRPFERKTWAKKIKKIFSKK